MNVLDLDIGNTRLKWRWTADVVRRGALTRSAEIVAGLPLEFAPKRIRVCSVAGAPFDRTLAVELSARYGIEPEFAHVTEAVAGVRCGYDDPRQLGVDRWLAVIGAWQRAHGAAVVVDVGSACTVDLLGPEGVHRGGYIVPGISMMAAALYGHTALVKVRSDDVGGSAAPGRTTADAVARGSQRMLADFIDGCVARLRGECENRVSLMLTGGDARSLVGLLATAAEVVDDLVFEGLAWVLP